MRSQADRPAIEAEAAQGAAPLDLSCDRIVNNGMGEPTECGRSYPCDLHDVLAAPRAEGLDEAVALLRDAQPNGMTIAPAEWQRRRRDLIAALDFDEIAEAVAALSRPSDERNNG